MGFVKTGEPGLDVLTQVRGQLQSAHTVIDEYGNSKGYCSITKGRRLFERGQVLN